MRLATGQDDDTISDEDISCPNGSNTDYRNNYKTTGLDEDEEVVEVIRVISGRNYALPVFHSREVEEALDKARGDDSDTNVDDSNAEGRDTNVNEDHSNGSRNNYKTTGLDDSDDDKVEVMDVETMYSFCPVAGIVCKLCQLRITTNPHMSTYPSKIRAHEQTFPLRHVLCHDVSLTENIYRTFMIQMEEIANQIIAAFTLDEARNVIIQYLEKGMFLYCSTCSKLVRGESHDSMKHTCHEMRPGYKSKYVGSSATKVTYLSMEFDLNDSCVCPELWELLSKKHLQSRMQFWSTTKTCSGGNDIPVQGTDMMTLTRTKRKYTKRKYTQNELCFSIHNNTRSKKNYIHNTRSKKIHIHNTPHKSGREDRGKITVAAAAYDRLDCEMQMSNANTNGFQSVSSSSMEEAPRYSFCPVGGIICLTCQYRITSHPHWKTYHQNIRRHEYSSIRHCRDIR